jgi:hypothetical protein
VIGGARRGTRAISLALVWLFVASGCGARSPRPLVVDPDAPVVSVERTPGDRSRALGDDAVARDLAVVLDVLETEYAGRVFVTPETFASTRRALEEITRRSHDVGSLCDAVGSALTRLIDPGLYVSADADASRRCRGDEGTAGGLEYPGVRVGEGIAREGTSALALRFDDEPERVAILGVRAFVPASDPSWSGAEETLRAALSARALVIDLRGARGADAAALAPLLATFSRDAPLAAIERAETSRAGAMRAAADALDLAESADVGASLSPFTTALSSPAAGADMKRDVVVLVDHACEEGCELVARHLATHADAAILGQVAWTHRLPRGEPGVIVLPDSGLRVVVPLRAVTVSAALAHRTGDRGSWFDRRGYGRGGDVVPQPDLLPGAIEAVRTRARHRARVTRLLEGSLPDCAALPRAASLSALSDAHRQRLDAFASSLERSHDATIFVDLPQAQASALVGACPGLRIVGAYALGPPGLDETGVHVVFRDVLDLTRPLSAEAVRRIEVSDPAEGQDRPDTGS